MDNALSRLPLKLRSMIYGLLTQPDLLSLLRIDKSKYEVAHPSLYKDGIINLKLGYGPPHLRLVTAPSAPSVGEVVNLPRPLIHTSRPRDPVSRTSTSSSTLAAVLRCTTPVSTIVNDQLTATHHLGSSHPTRGDHPQVEWFRGCASRRQRSHALSGYAHWFQEGNCLLI